MPNILRIDMIFKDVKGKVIKNAYIPKSFASKYKIEKDNENVTYVIKQK